jgi:S-adenosylmethionine uptake transporter
MQSLWVLAATFLFSLMGVGVKLASDSYGTGEILFYRGLVGFLVISLLCWLRGASLRTTYARMHLKRSVVGLISMALWFYTIAALPLATAMTLAYTSPLWVAAFALGSSLLPGAKPVDRNLVLIPFGGFIGVVLLLRPTFDQQLWFAGLLGVVGAVFAAFAYAQIRAVARVGEPEWRIVFYFSLGTTVVGLVWALAAGPSRPDLRGSMLLLSIGLSALAAQFALTRAFARGNTLTAVTLQYSGVLFAALWGILIWGDVPDMGTWFSMGLIVLSGVASTWLGTRRPDSDA